MRLDFAEGDGSAPCALPEILSALTDDAVQRHVIDDNSTARSLFDTALPRRSHAVAAGGAPTFCGLYAVSPQAATDWFYKFSGDVNYIRRDRIAKDMHWVYNCEYGALDITVNLSKPEKDPPGDRSGAPCAAVRLPTLPALPRERGLCRAHEPPGAAEPPAHPAQRLRRGMVLAVLSPYVYYNGHCIVLNSAHVPMKIDRAAFDKLLDLVRQLPHLFRRLECRPAYSGRQHTQP